MKWIKANKSMPPMFKDVEWRNANGGNIPLGKMSAIEIYKKAGANINSFEWFGESPALAEDGADGADGWVSVNDDLPNPMSDGRVLCWCEEINDLGKSYFFWNCAYSTQHGFTDDGKTYHVTHWKKVTPPTPTITNTPE